MTRPVWWGAMLGLVVAMLTVAALAGGRADASWDRIRYVGGALSAKVTLLLYICHDASSLPPGPNVARRRQVEPNARIVGRERKTAGELTGHFGDVNAAGFSTDARRLASIAQGHALIWDVTTHQAIGQCSWGASGARSMVALSPDGTIAAMSSWDDPSIGICSADLLQD
jgi:hypothetical protein